MKNVNPKENPITTIIGAVLLIVSVIMGWALFFEQAEYAMYKAVIAVILFVAGILFILSPDSLVTGANKVINKGTDKL